MATNANTNLSVPAMGLGNEFLENQLQQQAMNAAAARANAVAPLPENTQATGNAMGGVPPMADLSSEAQQQPEARSFAAPGVLQRLAEPQPFNDAIDDQRKVLTSEGEETTYDSYLKQIEDEKSRQAQAAGAANLDWESIADLRSRYPESVLPTQAGSIQRNSADIGEALYKSKVSLTPENSAIPVELSGMTYLQQGLNLNNTQTSNAINMAANLVAPMLAGASKTGNGEIKGEEEAFDYLNAILTQGGDVAIPINAVEGGVPIEVVEQQLGSLIKNFAKGKMVDGENNPLDPRTLEKQNIGTTEGGAVALQSLIDAEIYSIDVTPEGQTVVRLNPIYGAEFYQNGRGIRSEISNSRAGMAQTVPVTEEGEYIGAARNIRRGDKQKVNYQKIDSVTEAKRIAGSIGRVPSPGKAFIGTMLFNNALIEAQNDPQNPAPFSTLSIFKLNKQDIVDGSPVVIDKLNGVAKELKMLSTPLADGSPRYSQHWSDYSVQRLYNDSIDFNEQRNKFTRAISVPIDAPFMMDSDYHNTGVNKFTADKYWERIGNKAKAKDINPKSLSAQERELGFLMTLGRVLDVGKTLGLNTETMTAPGILEAVTPKFIIESAQIGAQLKSIVPADKRGIFNAMNNPSSVDPSALTPAQASAIKTLLDNSDRETWGYTLQGYVDAANYLDSKKNKTVFVPKATVAIDMNSAGRAFLAMDIGDFDLLERVGLIWGTIDRDSLFDNTQPYGNPRTYFVDVATKQSIDNAFGKDDQEKSLKFKELLQKYNNPGFNKSFAKKVLLTTDYGMPLQYHIGNARAFMKENPDFANDLVTSSSYNGDMEAALKDLNNIYKFTLKDIVSEWQSVLPKKITKVLQMLGRVPHPNGINGEKMSLGNMTQEETGNVVTVSGKSNERKIKETRAMFNPLAAAKSKILDDGTVYEPGEGTAAINQVGPLLGQYRESMLVVDTMNYINGNKDPAAMSFMMPVFDNFITDSASYPFALYVANNIVAPKILDWDIQSEFKKDFTKQIEEAFKEIAALGEVVIDKNSKYRGLFVTLDREYGYIKDKPIGSLDPAPKAFRQYLESKDSGYVLPKDRAGVTVLTPKQMNGLIAQAVVFFDISGARAASSNREGGMQSWIVNGLARKKRAMDKVRDLARRGRIYFMT
jgi:hypothetical protein